MTPFQKRILALHGKHFTVREIAERVPCSKTMVRNTIKRQKGLLAKVGEHEKPRTRTSADSTTAHATVSQASPTIIASLTSKEQPLYQGGSNGDDFKKQMADALKAKITFHLDSARKLKEALETMESNGVI